MDQLVGSCGRFSEYPKNLINHNASEHHVTAYSSQLSKLADRLFVDDGDATLEVFEPSGSHGGLQPTVLRRLPELKRKLREALVTGSDPHFRYISIHADHSLAPLDVSRDMLCFLFSYLQAMPCFLDFIFPFGNQEYAEDFYFSGLREESVLDSGQNYPPIPELGRTGRDIRLCYNLRSVEASGDQSNLPWSIRQTAVYHEFDIETGRSTWITVKGNTLIQKRLSNSKSVWQGGQVDHPTGAFAATLKAHLLLCEWSAENWRWYINTLEKQLQSTRRALSTAVDRPPSPELSSVTSPTLGPKSPRTFSMNFGPPSRINTKTSLVSPGTMSNPFSPKSFTSEDALPTTTTSNEKPRCATWLPLARGNTPAGKRTLAPISRVIAYLRSWAPWDDTQSVVGSSHENPQPLQPTESTRQEPPSVPPGYNEGDMLASQNKFRFSDLQNIQHIEEKTHELLLVLKLNTEVLVELRQHYSYITKHASFPPDILAYCQSDLELFDKRVRGVEREIQMQHARTDTLLRLLAERKQFLYGILQYQSMQASEVFAKRAQESATKMEAMTFSMHDIARKTKQETVSMRIITLVTLFFLPGTFIGTFMSTDIIQIDEHNVKHFQLQGLKIYLAICIPLMLVTFLAWYLVYRSVNRSERRAQQAAAAGAQISCV